MSLNPTNIPQLKNNGLGAGASLLGNSIAAQAGLNRARQDRRNSLLRAVLGGAVDLGEQVLENRGLVDRVKAGFENPSNKALTLSRLQDVASLGQAGDISSGFEQVYRLGGLGDPGGNGQTPSSGGRVPSVIDSDSSPSPAPNVPTGSKFDTTPEGAFVLGAGQNVVVDQPTNVPTDLPLGMLKNLQQARSAGTRADLNVKRGAKVDIDKQISDEKLTQEKFKTKKSQYGEKWFNNMTTIQTPGEQAVSTSGLPMKGLEVTPELAEDQAAIATQYANDPKAYDTRLQTLQKDTEGIVPLVRKVGNLRRLIKPGVKAQINRNVKTKEYMISVSGSEDAAKIKSILNSIIAQVPRIARLYGHTGVLTEPDVEKTLRDIPNALGSVELFDAQYKNFIEALSAGALHEAARLRNKKINDTFQDIYRDATKQDFRYGGGVSFTDGEVGDFPKGDIRDRAIEKLRAEMAGG